MHASEVVQLCNERRGVWKSEGGKGEREKSRGRRGRKLWEERGGGRRMILISLAWTGGMGQLDDAPVRLDCITGPP